MTSGKAMASVIPGLAVRGKLVVGVGMDPIAASGLDLIGGNCSVVGTPPGHRSTPRTPWRSAR